jgi:hypothetical protein
MKEFRFIVYDENDEKVTYDFNTQAEASAFVAGAEVFTDMNDGSISIYKYADLETIRNQVNDPKLHLYSERYQQELKDVLIELEKWEKE